MADQMDGKGRPPKRRSGLTRGQKGLIAAAAVLAVALAGVLAWQSLFVRPDLNTGKTEPQETEEPTDPVEEIDWGEGTRPRSDGERKSQDYYTVLILGRDTGGGGNTDTMLLASYDVTNQKATVMSIPRDTMVNVSWDIKRINSVYNYYGGGDRGIQYLYKEIAQLVGFEPDYQVVVEWDAVGQIVDAMGGVWFDVPRNMNYDDPYQDLHIHQEKGYRLLTGDDAMQVLRYRHDNDMRYGYPDGDLGRIKTQQAFLTAMVDQLSQQTARFSGGDWVPYEKGTGKASPGWSSISSKSTLLALTRGGVPVLNRRRGRPSFSRESVSRPAACIPSGPDSSTHSPTMVRPARYVPVARITAFTENTAPVASTTAETAPFSVRTSTTSPWRTVRWSCCSRVCFMYS